MIEKEKKKKKTKQHRNRRVRTRGVKKTEKNAYCNQRD
jgi:hypothetical protein